MTQPSRNTELCFTLHANAEREGVGVVRETRPAWRERTVKAARVESQYLAASVPPGEGKQTSLGAFLLKRSRC